MKLFAGTVQNMVTLANMDNKWKQKKKELGQKELAEMDPVSRQIAIYKEDLAKIQESRQKEGINNKLKAGEGLTPEEIDYLKKNDPKAYKEYQELQQEKEAYEKRLKSCKTKEDVESLKLNTMGQFMVAAKQIASNPNIPKGKKKELMERILKRVMGVQKKHVEFILSGRYHSLPTREEEEEKKKRKNERENPEQVDENDQTDAELGDLSLEDLRKKADKAFEEVKSELGLGEIEPPRTDAGAERATAIIK